MHHHQAESGMKGKEGKEWDDVARRHGVTEIMKLVGNKGKTSAMQKDSGVDSCWFLY